MPNINNPFLNQLSAVIQEYLRSMNAYEIAPNHIRQSDGDGCYYDLTLIAEAAYDECDAYFHRQHCGKFARLDDAESLLKDALAVLNAHAVGHKTQEAIEQFLGDGI